MMTKKKKSETNKLYKPSKNLTIFWWFPGGDDMQPDIATYRLNWPRGLLSKNSETTIIQSPLCFKCYNERDMIYANSKGLRKFSKQWKVLLKFLKMQLKNILIL